MSGSASRAPRPARSLPASAARRCSSSTGSPACPTDPRFAGGLTEQGVTGWTTWGRQNSNPQFQDPSVFNPRINYSWIRGRQSFKTGYEYQAINTQIDDFNPKYGRDTYGGQFSRPPTAAADPATYNLADFMFGLRNSYALINPFIANLRQRMHFAYLQDDFKATDRLTLNLGLRYEFATPQWEKDNFLTNFDPDDQHADPGEGRLDLRPRAGQPRPQQLRAAPRPGVLDRQQDGAAQRLRHQLHPLQPARRREPALVQRPARRRR